MPSLSQVRTQAPTLLVLDAASARVQVGLLSASSPARWCLREEEAGTALFAAIQELELNPLNVDGYLFCDGPGSILGIRSAAAALRAWLVLHPAPVWAYHSLSLVAALSSPELAVIADARRDSWHLSRQGQPQIARIPSAELAAQGPLATPAHFRTWTKWPGDLPAPITLPYDLDKLLPLLRDQDLFRLSPEPDAFLHEAPSYATWTPQIHKAPSPAT